MYVCIYIYIHVCVYICSWLDRSRVRLQVLNQFGFKKHYSTEMLIFLLKELFQHYITNGSSMYVTMLNASKAFDKVNHSKLLTKLTEAVLL